MRTPEEIKKELINAKHVQCMDISDGENECARTNYGVLVGYVLRDAIYIYITKLESDNESKKKRIDALESRLTQAERERDAAVADLSNSCAYCKHTSGSVDEPPCTECFHPKNNIIFAPVTRTKFEWRGVCPENTKEDSE